MNSSFIDAASAGRNTWPRYLSAVLLMIFGIAVINIGTVLGSALTIQWLDNDLDFDTALNAATSYLAVSWAWDTPYTAQDFIIFSYFLGSIGLSGLAVLAVVKTVHKRPIGSLIAPSGKFRWRLFWRSFLAGLIAGIIASSALWAGASGQVSVNADLGAVGMLVAAILILAPLQVFAEEVMFRGYILQSVAHYSHRTAVRLFVPSILFFAIHLGYEGEKTDAYIYAAYYFGIAFYLTWIAIKTDGLESSFGLHLAVNLIAFVLISDSSRPFLTPTIFYLPDAQTILLPFELTLLVGLHYWWSVRPIVNSTSIKKIGQ